MNTYKKALSWRWEPFFISGLDGSRNKDLPGGESTADQRCSGSVIDPRFIRYRKSLNGRYPGTL
ncbi:MAG: hypothetical protein ABIA75_00405 [Candidatus Neomarinimicrobiota bacterium]